MHALLIIHMQKDFCYENGALYLGENAKKTFEPTSKVIKTARDKGMPVIYTLDWHHKNDVEFDIWPPHCVMGTEGAQIVDELTVSEDDYIIKSRKYSVFFGTDLDLTLRELGIERIFVGGVATNICVLHTVADAAFRSYAIDVIEDCTGAISHYEQEYGINHMKNVIGAEIINSDSF